MKATISPLIFRFCKVWIDVIYGTLSFYGLAKGTQQETRTKRNKGKKRVRLERV